MAGPATSTTPPTRRTGRRRTDGPLPEPSTAVGGAALAWPQRYAQLLDAHTRLQQTLAAHETAHRKALTVVKYAPALPNNDVFTKELLEQNHELTQRCRTLELRLAMLDMGHSSVSMSPRRSVDRSSTRRATPRVRVKHASVQTPEVDNNKEDKGDTVDTVDTVDTTKPAVVPDHVLTLIAMLKERLVALDVDVARLQHENELLRTELGTATARASHEPTEPAQETMVLRTHEQQQELEHLFHDRVQQMRILEEQLTHLQHKVSTGTLLYRESLDKVEQLTGELFEAKQTLLQQAEWLHAQRDANAQLQLLEKEVHVLRRENATLNETVAVLSARPLDALNVQLEKKALQLSLLEETNAALEQELQQARQDHGVVMHTNDKLRKSVEALTKASEAPVAEIQALKAERERLVGEREIAVLQLQFYLSGDSIESNELMEAVGKALKSMRVEKDGSQSTAASATARARDSKAQTEKRDAHTLQTERLEKMVHVTTLIQEETRAQLHELKVAHAAELRDLKRQCARWQQRADDYLREITTLRAEPLASAAPQRLLGPSNQALQITSPRPKLPSSHAEESLLEVRLYDLRYSGGVGTEAPSFVLFCDYFDFESQPSPVFALDADNRTDVAPVEMEVSYKLLLNQAFCRSPLAHSLTVELHHLRATSSLVVAVADVSLQSLFFSEQGYAAMSVKLLDPTTRTAVGTVRVALRLSRAANHLFKAWPIGDHARVRPMPPLGITRLETSSPSAIVHLQIRVIAIAVACSEASADVATVRYRFMGNAPVQLTIPTSARSRYGFNVMSVDRATTFEVPRDDQIVAFLGRYELTVHTERTDGTRATAQVPFGSAVTNFRHHGVGSAIVSAVVSTTGSATGDSTQASPVGRVWCEVQLHGANASLAANPLEAWRRPIVRLFGSDDGTQIGWHRFCAVMAFTPVDRAVRQLMADKLKENGATQRDTTQTLRQLLRNASSEKGDELSTVFQRAGLSCSRSELSFVTHALFPSDAGDFESDTVENTRRIHAQGRERLLLLIETVDTHWLRVEPRVRSHVDALGLLVEHAHDDAEWMTWETFAHRIRLIV